MAIKTVLAIIAIVSAVGLLALNMYVSTVSAIACQTGFKPRTTPHGEICVSVHSRGPDTVGPHESPNP